MRSWVLSPWLIAPVSTNRTRLRAKSGSWGRAANQMASRRAVTWSTMPVLAVRDGDAVVDQALIQGQLW
jgi:hypothetical protein